MVRDQEPAAYTQEILHGAACLPPRFPRRIPGITLNTLVLGIPLHSLVRPPEVRIWPFENRDMGLVGQTLGLMARTDRLMLDLRYVGGYSSRQIAEITGINLTLVNPQIQGAARFFNSRYTNAAKARERRNAPAADKKPPSVERKTGKNIVLENGASGNFPEIYEVYWDRIYNCVYRLLGSQEDAADTTQQAFLRAYEALPKVQGELKVGPWIYQIATNLSMDQLRRRKLIRWEPIEDRNGIFSHRTQAPDNPADEYEREETIEETREEVHEALKKVSPRNRAALTLYEFEDKSCEEIAIILGTTQSAVKSMLFRGRVELKYLLTEIEPPFSIQGPGFKARILKGRWADEAIKKLVT